MSTVLLWLCLCAGWFVCGFLWGYYGTGRVGLRDIWRDVRRRGGENCG